MTVYEIASEKDPRNDKLMPRNDKISLSHHVVLATPRNEKNGFIAISCCSICT
ncbi:hypothetical protein KSMBR1_0643 [Candidatus Kuenenia stuttgartiensis]|uniref:Uncharacterized protein n=1 Tax=Kuenenia stuttgartiensis TaxID=174633 RepID=A0A2C9CEI8_KUEST|nr:hypothetical protein KSMBR1_0643 [Candidatus Kuenenia stuttgartiensis]